MFVCVCDVYIVSIWKTHNQIEDLVRQNFFYKVYYFPNILYNCDLFDNGNKFSDANILFRHIRKSPSARGRMSYINIKHEPYG